MFWLTPLIAVIAQLLFLPNLARRSLDQNFQEPQVKIDSPKPEEVLRGVVSINGTTGTAGFRSAEVAFAYQTDSTSTWFPVQPITTPVTGGLLANWDTTTISDGMYRLRLKVFLQDGQVLEDVVSGLRVRNYTQVETSTPAPALANGQPTQAGTATPLADFKPKELSLTALPTNPAQVTSSHLQVSALQGVMVVFGALAVTGVYLGLRVLTRR